ncbi:MULTISPECIES: hypothetical protein [unclassified Streptomyces]|uniref:hypothetical protein n=1 Tax=unclassified Streptomyces TaxID=2593676 RepID=UPI0037F3CBAB
METHTVTGEHERLSTWFATAAPAPTDALATWRLTPHYPRRLSTDITFDVVLADHSLVELSYKILHRYEQNLKPTRPPPGGLELRAQVVGRFQHRANPCPSAVLRLSADLEK